jgi:hypothetical protein
MSEDERGLIAWLFDAIFGRTQATEEDIGDAIHRLGDAKQRSKRSEDDD